MEERLRNSVPGFYCTIKVWVLVGLFLLGSLSRGIMNFM